jgi:hypothetical protein
VNKDISGVHVATIKNSTGKLKAYFTRVQNQSLPINVLRCDFNKRAHMEYLFTIFHRLNAGGMKLNNQEIRNCIYGGSLNDLLADLDRNKIWRKLNRMTDPDYNYRFVKQEVILRFFAFEQDYRKDVKGRKYKGQVAKFLNDFMYEHRSDSPSEIEAKRALFVDVVQVLDRVFPNGPDSRIPTSVLESALVGIANNVQALKLRNDEELQSIFTRFRSSPEFNEEAVAEGLSKKDKVDARFNAAFAVFGTP